MGNNVSTLGEGIRQQRAALVRAEMEAKANPTQRAAEPGDTTPQGVEEAAGEWTSTGPLGAGDYLVTQGDCIASIAKDKGHFWETIWNDPANVELRAARQNPDLLLPGDRVAIPAKRRKAEQGETEMRHRFRRRGEPASLHFILKDVAGRPRGNEPYVIEIDGQASVGTTDTNGQVDLAIPGNAQSGRLTLTRTGESYLLQLGSLAPLTEVSGIQGRLRNLGFDCGLVDGRYGPKSRSALAAFQRRHSLEPTGECDEATRSKLLQEHRC